VKQADVIVDPPVYFFQTGMKCGINRASGIYIICQVRNKALKITNLYAFLSTVELFGKQQRIDVLLDAQRRNDATRRSEEVKNGVILRQFTDANRELPFRGRDESSTSLNNGNFVEYLNVLTIHSQLLENHLNSTTII
jgi:hypothetical protein